MRGETISHDSTTAQQNDAVLVNLDVALVQSPQSLADYFTLRFAPFINRMSNFR
jgi:hypothetical protein